ncbi:hypothetical protein BX666DRAFT_1414268 [Dichotomocladium elegans]|nr:hypothetical protein BX666DRAFT_1414268 [Dichotomocladium elegans]
MARETLHDDGWCFLPHDILLWINGYLDHEDRYACLHVCRQWYSVFVLQFYAKVAILNVQQCTRLSTHLDTVGDGIRNLQVKLSTDDLEAWRRLSQWHFPALQSLSIFTFDKQHFPHTTSSCDAVSATANRSEFRSMITGFIALQSSLTYLDLSVPHLHNALLLSVLKKLPRLLTLELNGMSGYLTCADMDYIHESCPELRHVKISAEQFITQGRALRRNRNLWEPRADVQMQLPVAGQHDAEDILLRLFPLDTSQRPVASKLVSLHVSIYRGLEEHMCDWFVYASRNYPHLQCLSLEARPENQCRVGEREFEFDLLNMIMDYRWADAVWKRAELVAFRLFVRSCPEVKSLTIKQLYLTRSFLDTIFTCELPITSFGFTMNIHNPWQTGDRNWFFSSTLVSLSLQACITYPATNVMFMTFLGTMPCLRHLQLSRYEDFDMGTLLQHCTQLQTLTLEHLPILSSDLPATSGNKLHTIELRHVIVRESFFTIIPKGLRNLTLQDTAVVGAEKMASNMWMPHIAFETLHLCNLLAGDATSPKRTTVKVRSSRLFVFFGVETNGTPCRWYDERRSTTIADERILGIRPLSSKQVDEDILGRTQRHRLHILCRSAQKVHINGKRLLDQPADLLG